MSKVQEPVTLSSLSSPLSTLELNSNNTATKCPFANPSRLFDDFSSVREKSELEYSAVLGGYVVTRYQDIVHVLDKPEIFSSRVTVPEFPDFVEERFAGRVPAKGTLLAWDNPDHDRLRQSVSSFFVPRRLLRFGPAIRDLANELVDGFIEHGNGDLKNIFALPLPLKVVSLVAGLDPARWQWTGRSLALFGGHAAMAEGTMDQKIQGIIDIHKYVADLIQLRKTDRRDDLISHIWNERDAGKIEMTDFEHLAMIPGLLLAGHETTTNLLSMGTNHLLELGLWDEALKNESSRTKTIEELLRFESAITGMKREVVSETKIGETVLNPGDVLFVAYNSGSHDPTLFASPEKIILNRASKTQHLGFGRGIHACLGAPLARLLLNIEFEILYERFSGLRLAKGFQIQYDRVHEGRGIDKLLVEWDQKPSKPVRVIPRATHDPQRVRQAGMAIRKTQVTISKVQLITEDIVLLTLTPQNGIRLPPWTAGAHIDLPVGKLGSRQYSLCSDPKNDMEWQVAVLREKDGTGGSQYVHNNLTDGMSIILNQPRNHFPLKDSARYLFIAGGIGITPIKAMILEARSKGTPYHLLYLGSTRSRMAFVDDEVSRGQHADIWPADERGRCDLNSALHSFGVLDVENAQDYRIYACGPSRLLAALESICARLPSGILNVEHFENTNISTSSAINKSFDVELRQSGRVLHVPENRGLLEVLNENGCGILSTCTKGTCGTCEIGVLGGTVDHRDTVLTNEEKEAGKSIMACVSRCLDERLVLDLF